MFISLLSHPALKYKLHDQVRDYFFLPVVSPAPGTVPGTLALCPLPLCSLLIPFKAFHSRTQSKDQMSLLWRSFPFFFSPPYPPQQCIHNAYHITPHFALPVKSAQLSILSASPSWAGTLSDRLYIFSTWHMTGLPSRFISELKLVGIQAGMDKLCLQSPLINR